MGVLLGTTHSVKSLLSARRGHLFLPLRLRLQELEPVSEILLVEIYRVSHAP